MAHSDDISALADEAIARLKADLEDVVTRLRAYLGELLKSAAVDAEGKLVAGDVNAELAAKLEADFSGILQDLGYEGALHDLMSSFEAVAQANDAHLTDTLDQGLSSANREALSSFASNVVDELVHLEGVAGGKLRQLVILGSQTHVPRDDLLEQLVDAAGITLRQAITEADTSIMAFHREALETEAEDAGFDLFVYDGPDDSICRPFCAEHVGRVYTTQDLDDEDNGQDLEPTSRYLGGYNCRHSLSPVTVEEAQAMVEKEGASVIGGREARRIVLRGGTGKNEQAFALAFTGSVVTRGGKQQVVRRRRAA